MNPTRLGSIAVIAGGALCLAEACARTPRVTPMTHGHDAQVVNGFDRVRAATSAFVVLDSAVAVGYPREVQQCLADAQHGAMGFHHVNRGYVDTKLEVERPEILLYERRADGKYRLNGVEYIIPYRLWSRDSVPPTIMGLNLKREENLKLWYLHMWVWTENSAGLFADYNPSVKCEGSPAH